MCIFLSFDVEQDCPPYLNSEKGMKIGLNRILNLLDKKDIKATFFFTAKIGEKYPELIKKIVNKGHELGCHGFDHERLDKISKSDAESAIINSLNILRKFDDVVSFRAPNLQIPDYLFKVLRDNEIFVDSSKALYKGFFKRNGYIDGVFELRVSITSSVMRLPWNIQEIIHKSLNEPRVYFVHPWEYVDMKNENIRFDCKFNTGNKALGLLEKFIDYNIDNSIKFMLVRDSTLRQSAQSLY